MKKIIYHLILITQLSQSAWAQQNFVVKQIEFSGLNNLSSATAKSYLPIKRGDVLEPAKTTAILKALYSTGFFDHISLSKKGSTLVIHVTERPTIGQLKI